MMNHSHSHAQVHRVAIALLLLWSTDAVADITNSGILDSVLNRYALATGAWASVITAHASRLFWTLSLISMVWTFGFMALRQADLSEFFAEFIKFIIFTGFFWWLLINGPYLATTIITSLRMIGASASGNTAAISPSGIVDIGFSIFAKVLEKTTIWSPISSAVGLTISLLILISLALISVNMLNLLISGWILAYAGIFFLGFGGSRWTSEMAIGYFRTILNVAAQIFAMVLLVGIGQSVVDNFYTNISTGINLNELAVILVVAIGMLALVAKIPGLIGGLAAGGGTGALGGGFGAGAVVGAATMGAAAVASVTAGAISGGASIGGGAQALMAAFSKANRSEAMRNATNDFSNTGGGTSGTGATAQTTSRSLGEAMGNAGCSTSPAPDKTSSTASKGGVAPPDEETKTGNAPTGSSNTAMAPEASTARTADDTAAPPSEPDSSAPTSSEAAPEPTDQATDKNPEPTSKKAENTIANSTAKVARVIAGTGANLALGTWDVAKEKGGDLWDRALDRVGTTSGGQIAKAINTRAEKEQKSHLQSEAGGNSISSGADETIDAKAEVAAFRDSKSS